MDVYGKLIEAAKMWPNREAIFSQGRWTTFSELLDMVQRLIAGLRAKGMKEGEKLAICLPNSIEYISILIASMGVGLTVVPLDPTYRRDDLLNVISHGKIEYLFTYRSMDLPGIKQEIRDLNSLLGSRIKERLIWEDDRLAMILYTSGTTGTPKAVPYTFRQLSSPIEVIRYFELQDDMENLICHVPLSHLGGIVHLLMTLCFGSKLVLGERFIPRRLVHEIEQHRITALLLPPNAIEASLLSAGLEPRALNSLRLIVYFGAPGREGLIEEIEKVLPRVKAITGWGLTESTAPIVILPKELPAEIRYRKGIVGKACPWVEIGIVDEEGNRLGPEEEGEIVVKGWPIMKEYYNAPEFTREVLKEGWLFTGDLGFIDKNGLLYISGRKKDIIIVGGLIINPTDIESTLKGHPKINDAAVIGVKDRIRGEAVKAFVVPSDKSLNKKEVIAFCRKRLPGYKVPRYLEFIDAIPRTPSGKIKRKALQERYHFL